MRKNRRRSRLMIVAVLALIIAAIAILAGFIFNKPTETNASIQQVIGTNVQTNISSTKGGDTVTDTQIAKYQDQAKTRNDADSYGSLGLAYLQKAREVGDPVYYTKAEGVLKKALELDGNNITAMEGMGSLSLSRHQFAEALDWGQKAQKISSAAAYNYGVMTDALVELGRYDDAVNVVQQMVDLRPDISSYSRISYLRELYGRYDGPDSAIEAMAEAVEAGGPTTENTVWVTYQLGMLYFNKNDIPDAQVQFQQALAVSPGYVYALEGMARIKAAQGDLTGALAIYTDITQRYPLTQFIIEMGDLLGQMNRTADAQKQYDLVRGIDRIYKQNGVDTDVEMSLFNADHDYNLQDTLAQIKKEYAARPSVHVDDVYAWTLYKTGDYKAAADMEAQALRLGSHDALYWFHAGMIADKLGQNAAARADLDKSLSYNPNFSMLYADTAHKTLAALGGPLGK